MSVRQTMAIATANAHAATRREGAPVATARVVGPTMEIRNAKVGLVWGGVVWMAMSRICAESRGYVSG